MNLLAQQLLDPLHGFLPTHVLLDGQSLERLDRGFGRALRLQVGLEDVYVVIEPLQILLLDRRDAFQDLAGVEEGFGICEGVRGSGWRLAFDEGDVLNGRKR
jgi:hypothetical protein